MDDTDPHTINISYEPLFSSTYLRSEVRLEIGPLAEMVPFGEYRITPYAAEAFPNLFEQPEALVQTIKPERTFWEKITILPRSGNRMKRRQRNGILLQRWR